MLDISEKPTYFRTACSKSHSLGASPPETIKQSRQSPQEENPGI